MIFGPEAQLERWEFTQLDEEQVKSIGHQYSLSRLLSRLLIIRGLTKDEDQLKQFLTPPRALMTDVSGLGDADHLQRALERIKKAIVSDEKIVIHGDPDADGITGTTILVARLRQFKARVAYDFPIRAIEGHGLQPRIIEEAKDNDVKLLITTDCGTKDVEAVAYAKSLGIDVIITDHHIMGNIHPDAHAIINPQMLEPDSQFKVLSGAGVAFKVIMALFTHMNESFPKPLRQYLLSLVSLGTLSDRMSLLVPMNRLLVQRGVEALSETNMEGLKVLKRVCGHGMNASIHAHELTRTIVPRLNAPGRIGNPKAGIADSNLVVDLLLVGTGSSNAKRATVLLNKFLQAMDEQKPNNQDQPLEQASIVNEVNEERKKITSQIEDEIDRLIDEQVDLKHDRVILIRGKNWNPGVIGIDADRLKERFLRPAIILTSYPDSEYVRGSARSIPGINLYRIIEEADLEFEKEHGRKLFLSTVQTPLGERQINAFGGHSQACGFSIHQDLVEPFVASLREKMTRLDPADFYCRYEIIDELELNQISVRFIRALNHMGPYGQHFDFPAFVIKKCHLSKDGKLFGNKYQKVRFPHVQFDVLNEHKNGYTQRIKAIGFGLADKYQTLVQTDENTTFDIICTLELDMRRPGRRGYQQNRPETVRLNVKDIRLSADSHVSDVTTTVTQMTEL